MKRWTLALLSLIFSIGWVSAQTKLETPVFSPASGVIAPGTEIVFELPENAKTDYAFILYAVNDADVQLEATYMELMLGMQSMFADMNFKVAMAQEGEWMIPCTISETGEVTLRARLAVPVEDESGGAGGDDDMGMGGMVMVYSDIITATYTVEGEAAKPTAPTFSPEEGEVTKGQKITLTNGYVDNPLYMIYYTVNNPDESVFQVTSFSELTDLEDAKKLVFYTDPFAIDASQTIRAATAQVDASTSGITWSDVVTAVYTIKETPVQPDLPDYVKFSPTPETGLTIAEGAETELFIRPVAQDGKKGDVYYRILTVDGADQNAPVGANDTKIETKQEGGTLNYLPIKVNETMVKNGQFIVKAAVKYEDGTFSPEATAVYKVEVVKADFPLQITVSPVNPALKVGGQYVFTAGFAMEPEALAAATPVMLRISCRGSIDVFSNVEYAIVPKGSEPEARNWTSFMADFEEEDGDYDHLGETVGRLVESDLKLRLTLKKGAPAGNLDISIGALQPYAGFAATVYGQGILSATIEKLEAENPTFTPAPGYIERGKTVTLACVTPGAEIRYTTDGTEPTPSSTLYEAPIAINTLTTIKAIAVKNGKTSFVAEGVYSMVGLPQITPASGKVVIDSLAVITVKETPDAVVYYTLDGSEPTAAGTRYTAPFPIGASVRTLKAIAVLGEEKSPVVTADYQMIPATPTVSYPAGKVSFGTEVALACATEGAEIYWSFGSQEPISKATGKKYDGKPIAMKLSGILKAIAYYAGDSSKPLSAKYTVGLSMPAFSLKPGAVPVGARVTLTSESKELNTNPNKLYHIVYTLDGSEPSKENGKEYTAPIEITEAVTIKAMTWSMGVTGIEKSEVAEATYWIEGEEEPDVDVADPVFEPAAGTVEKGTQVGLSTKTAGATIHYTVDGSEPTAESAEYAKPITVDEDVTIKAIAVLGHNKSNVVTATYTIKREQVDVITPTFDPAAGEVEKGTPVTIACVTEGAKIYYTVDGSMPTAESTEYKEAVVINEALTLKAIAFVGEFKSSVATAVYTIKGEPVVEVATPTFTPGSGEVEKGTKVEIACATENAKIYYTVDGSEPTAQSAEYKEAVVINEAMTLKAIAFVGESKSEVATAAYTVKTANEEPELAGVSVYPNPSDGEFTLDLPVSATVEVYASNGVLRQRVAAGAGVMTLNIERSGIYFLRITAEGRTTVKRVVVR